MENTTPSSLSQRVVSEGDSEMILREASDHQNLNIDSVNIEIVSQADGSSVEVKQPEFNEPSWPDLTPPRQIAVTPIQPLRSGRIYKGPYSSTCLMKTSWTGNSFGYSPKSVERRFKDSKMGPTLTNGRDLTARKTVTDMVPEPFQREGPRSVGDFTTEENDKQEVSDHQLLDTSKILEADSNKLSREGEMSDLTQPKLIATPVGGDLFQSQSNVAEEKGPCKISVDALIISSEPDCLRTGLGHRIKFGDNSIITDCQADTPIYNLPPVTGPSNFLTKGQRLLDRSNIFQNDQHEMAIKSLIDSCDPQVPPTVISRTVLQNKAVPLEEVANSFCTVVWGRCIMKENAKMAVPSSYFINTLVKGYDVADVLQSTLGFANYHSLCRVAGVLHDECTYYDNSGMYAKLIYWASVLDLMEVTEQTPAFNEFDPDDNTITYINVADDEMKPDVLRDEIMGGSFILVKDTDYFDDDVQTILWMARAGSRVRAAPNSRTPNACYTKWPAIKVCLLGHEDAETAWPSAAPQTANQLLYFAFSLATKRSEDYDLCRGIYYVMDLMGTRYSILEGVNYRLGASFNTAQPRLPRPYNPNYLGQLLTQRPCCKNSYSDEWSAWMRAGSSGRICLITLYVACIETFTTTYLYSVSISTSDITHWLTGQEIGILFSLSDIFSSSTKEESRGFSIPKLAMCHYLEVTIEQNLYRDTPWCGHFGHQREAAKIFEAHGMDNQMPPRYGSCLCIDNFLIFRPQEWAVLGPNTTVIFSSDLRWRTRAEKIGLFSLNGERAYHARVSSNEPYLIVPYGVQMLNVFSQYFRLDDFAPSYNATEYEPHCPEVYSSHHFLAGLHIFEPCTVRTFDFEKKEIRAPAVVVPEMTYDRARCVSCWGPSELPDIGFQLNRAPSLGLIRRLRRKGCSATNEQEGV